MADIAPMQTDRPLGEMSDEELWARHGQAVNRWRGARSEYERIVWGQRMDKVAAELLLPHRERRSATRETGAQDDA